MGLLQTLGNGQGYLKAGFLGFQSSGKTYTAVLLAIGVRKFFGLTGPIAFYDTEGGTEYIAGLVKKETGLDLLGVRSRSFDDLCAWAKECHEAGVSVAIADSVTHPWRELCDAYLAQVNAGRARKNLSQRRSLEFQDWSHIKGRWAKWTDLYLNLPMHMIVCGRAGDIYAMEQNEETGKKELIKAGVKMKTETEFGFEPSLLVEMDREQVPDGKGGFRLRRSATVIKDRFAIIDGATTHDPGFDFFKPHIELLKPGAHAPVDTSIRTDAGIGEDGDAEWHRERKTRTILCEEIQGELVAAYPGMDAESKQKKAGLIYDAFNTRSWTAVESKHSQELREGLAFIRQKLRPEPVLTQAEKDAIIGDIPDTPPAAAPADETGGSESPAEPAASPVPGAKASDPGGGSPKATGRRGGTKPAAPQPPAAGDPSGAKGESGQTAPPGGGAPSPGPATAEQKEIIRAMTSRISPAQAADYINFCKQMFGMAEDDYDQYSGAEAKQAIAYLMDMKQSARQTPK